MGSGGRRRDAGPDEGDRPRIAFLIVRCLWHIAHAPSPSRLSQVS
ncbi:hypothetical protein FRACA_70008 [Frankia canadensis]|uniref:Uncharacterized protein n=1 Tax=Frankia canadensis TaxID=1836972 RepID=A0A2I2L0E3_9ACTN|nr:hypothetical protein FRACA_70008 [Frankia canadensis]SOU58682.1 hypothetical protein FRACA_70008 [Frankia canadensis]